MFIVYRSACDLAVCCHRRPGFEPALKQNNSVRDGYYTRSQDRIEPQGACPPAYSSVPLEEGRNILTSSFASLEVSLLASMSPRVEPLCSSPWDITERIMLMLYVDLYKGNVPGGNIGPTMLYTVSRAGILRRPTEGLTFAQGSHWAL